MLLPTNLVIVSAQLPPDFIGTPAEFYQAMIERMSIQSPSGTQFFVVGDSEPSGNQGPWLRFGTQWWVFDVTLGRYVPLDISSSVERLFIVGASNPGIPEVGDPLLWVRTVGSRGASWYGWTGTEWRPLSGVTPSGPTVDRPSDALELELFFDTDINTMLHWERGMWRTVSGSPGDVKHVTHPTAASALAHSPGWEIFGQADGSVLGRVIGNASNDTGLTPTASLPVGTGITPRAAGDQTGGETHVLGTQEIEQHTHVMGHATALNSDNNVELHRVDDGEDVTIPPPVPPNHFLLNGDGGGDGTQTGTAGDGPTGTALITSKQLSLANEPNYTAAAIGHNTMQPTVFLWALVKL